MNLAFDVALNRPAATRNFAAFVGDQFVIAISIYEADGDVAKATLTGNTARIEILRCGDVEVSIPGVIAAGVVTFDFGASDLSGIVGRNVFRCKLTRAGKVATVACGAFTVAD